MIKLVIVDDEETTREGLRKFIPWVKLGVDVLETASNGMQALEVCARLQPDILLCDIRMPDLSGIEVANRVKEILPECRILLLSAYTDKEYLKSAIKMHVDSYLEKPVDREELTATIRETVFDIIETRRKNLEKDTMPELFVPIMTEFKELLYATDKNKLLDMVKALSIDLVQSTSIDIKQARRLYFDLFREVNHLLTKSKLKRIGQDSDIALWEDVQKYATIDEMTLRLTERVCELLAETEDVNAADAKIFKIMKFINEHYGQKELSVLAIAAHTYLAPTYICMLFKNRTGKTIYQYITEVRIENAKRLIGERDIKIASIAKMVGYDSPNHFSKVFRKNTGINPSQYRSKQSQ